MIYCNRRNSKASAELIEKAVENTGFAFIIELTELNGMKNQSYNCKSLVK
jgi:hypothetical protein